MYRPEKSLPKKSNFFSGLDANELEIVAESYCRFDAETELYS